MQHHRVQRTVTTVGRHVTDRGTDILALGQHAEDRVVEIEVPDGSLGDEELAVIGVVGCLGHSYQAGSVVLQVDVVLVVEVTERRATGTGAGWVTALDHKVIDDPVEDRAVIESALGQLDDLCRCPRSPRFEQLECHRPKVVDLHS